MSSNSAQLSGLSNLPTAPTSAHQYDDIIHLDRPPIPAGHSPMNHSGRAAQFMPFSALSGYQDVVDAAEADSIYRSSEIIFEDIDEIPSDEDAFTF